MLRLTSSVHLPNTQGQDHGWSTWVHLLVWPLQRLQPMSGPDWTCGCRHCREQVTIHHLTLHVIDLQHFFLLVSQCRFVKRLIATTTVGEGGSLFGSWNLIVHTPLRLSIHGAAIGGKKQIRVILRWLQIISLSQLMYCRITIFHFVVEDTREKPTVTFMGEQPNLQYVSGRVHCIHSMELINSYTISFFCFTSELSCDWEMYWTAKLCWLQVLRVLLTHATKGSLSFTHCCVYCGYVIWLELLLNFFYSCRKNKNTMCLPCTIVMVLCEHVHMWMYTSSICEEQWILNKHN